MALRRVELYGPARLLAGAKIVDLDLDEGADLRDVGRALAQWRPALLGPVLAPTFDLLEGYTYNLNGTRFVRDSAHRLEPGDVVILMASAAGGCHT